MSEETRFTVLTHEQAEPEAQLLSELGPRVLSHYPVTPGIPISDSGNQQQRVFLHVPIDLGPIDPARVRVFLSGLPTTNAPIIADDVLMVNGRYQGSFAGVTADPKRFIGQDPIVCYRPVEAPEITGDLRRDGKLYITALDAGGHTFCCSRLYVRVVPR